MADQQFCLRWNNHQSTLISVFDTLLENGTLVDCTLAAEGQYLKAHKVVLSACSPYLETLLSQHYEKHPIVILKDVKFTELKSMMDYMYRGEVNISQDQLGTFLKAAESLQIKGLSDNGADGDARDVGSTAKVTPRKANVPAPSNRPEPARPDSPLTDGSMSPSSRKRRRIRRSSRDDDSHLENNSCDLPSQAQSTPVPNIPAANSSITTTTIVKPAIVKPEQTDIINRIDSNTLPPEALKKEIEPISEPLLEPKTEYLEDVNNEDSVEDLTLDDDDDMDGMDISNMSNMSNMSRPGPSHGNDISSQSFAAWNLGANQSGTDEVFMAAQEAVNQHRDSQGARVSKSTVINATSRFTRGKFDKKQSLKSNQMQPKLKKKFEYNPKTNVLKSPINRNNNLPSKPLIKVRTNLFKEGIQNLARSTNALNSSEIAQDNKIRKQFMNTSKGCVKVKKPPEVVLQAMKLPQLTPRHLNTPEIDAQCITKHDHTVKVVDISCEDVQVEKPLNINLLEKKKDDIAVKRINKELQQKRLQDKKILSQVTRKELNPEIDSKVAKKHNVRCQLVRVVDYGKSTENTNENVSNTCKTYLRKAENQCVNNVSTVKKITVKSGKSQIVNSFNNVNSDKALIVNNVNNVNSIQENIHGTSETLPDQVIGNTPPAKVSSATVLTTRQNKVPGIPLYKPPRLFEDDDQDHPEESSMLFADEEHFPSVMPPMLFEDEEHMDKITKQSEEKQFESKRIFKKPNETRSKPQNTKYFADYKEKYQCDSCSRNFKYEDELFDHLLSCNPPLLFS